MNQEDKMDLWKMAILVLGQDSLTGLSQGQPSPFGERNVLQPI